MEFPDIDFGFMVQPLFRPITLKQRIKDILVGTGWEANASGNTFKAASEEKKSKLKICTLQHSIQLRLFTDFEDGRNRIVFDTVDSETEFIRFCDQNGI